MKQVEISRFQLNCLALLERVCESGESFLITQEGKPIAQVVPPEASIAHMKSGFGCMAGTFEILGDIVEPLGEADWEVYR